MQHTKKFFIPLLTILCFCALAACGNEKEKKKAAQGMQPIPVNVLKVEPTTLALSQEWSAQTVAQDAVEIRSRVEGFLEKRLFTEGSAVKEGDLLFVIDQNPFKEALTRAQAAYDKTIADLNKAKADLKRYEDLYKQEVISREQYDSVATKATTLAADVKSAKAAVAEAKINLGYTNVTAPISGRIGAASVNEGALVSPGQTLLAKIVTLDPIYVKFAISEQEYLAFASKSSSEEELPQGKGVSIQLILSDGKVYGEEGKLSMADPEIDPKTGTLGIRLVFDNPDRLLLPGQFCTVRATLDKSNNKMIAIPQRAVISVQGHTTVLAVNKDNVLESRTVTLGGRSGAKVVIKDGLSAGDMIVTEGVQKLRAGMPVKPVTSQKQE